MTTLRGGQERSHGIFPAGSTPVDSRSLPVDGQSIIGQTFDKKIGQGRAEEAERNTNKLSIGEALRLFSSSAAHFLSLL